MTTLNRDVSLWIPFVLSCLLLSTGAMIVASVDYRLGVAYSLAWVAYTTDAKVRREWYEKK